MSRELAEDEFVCRSYTFARRHPMIIGQLGGFRLPTLISPTQLCVLVGSVFVLVNTMPIWGLLGGVGNLMTVVVVSLGLAWSVRHLRMEGRSPLRMFGGLVMYLSRRSMGATLHGRPQRPARAKRVAGRVYVAVPAKASVGVAARPGRPRADLGRRGGVLERAGRRRGRSCGGGR